MNETCYQLCGSLLGSKTYIEQGHDARKAHEKKFQWLLQHRKLPEDGWNDTRIKLLLNDLAVMDSNNFPGNIGLGEREARMASRIVEERHFGFGHGIGRSGDIAAVQPKAAGSSVLNQLTNSIVLDLIQRSGMRLAKRCVLIPVATGMALTIVLLTIRQINPSARFVIWPRIDQKSCFKSISAAGFEPIVIENILQDDELRTDVAAIEMAIKREGGELIACVLTTTSCFAPRGIDRLSEVSKLCERYNVPHIINNAYGVQAPRCMNLICEADRIGRVDAFVQSTDKNFLVPVGGAVVASSKPDFITKVSQAYPGRASSTPTIDVFITLLSLGWEGYRKLQLERKENYDVLRAKLNAVAETHGTRLLNTPNNPISIGMDLTNIIKEEVDWKEFGSMLFVRNVSGTRVVSPGTCKDISNHQFVNWGSHSNDYPFTYLTVAAAIGLKSDEIDTFCKRLDKTLVKFKKDKEVGTANSGLVTKNGVQRNEENN